MHFVILKQSLVSANESHFSGGKHVVQQMANVLAAQGQHRVSLVSVSSRGEVGVIAILHDEDGDDISKHPKHTLPYIKSS